MGLAGKIVLVRVDFNVPMDDGVIMDDARIRVPLKTIQDLRNRGAKVVLMSHLGKTSNGDKVLSLRQLIPTVEKIYGCPVTFIENYLEKGTRDFISKIPQNDMILFENLRFHKQ